MKKDKLGKLLVTISALSVLLIFIFNLSFQKKTEEINMYGNTANNLKNGGSVAQRDNNLFIVFPNESKNMIVLFDEISSKMNILKTFLSMPSEMCVYDKYLFYKKDIAKFSYSGLYRMNTKTKIEKKIINEPINQYIVYGDSIYYTTYIYDEDTTKGLYKCNADGKKNILLIPENISEFIVLEKYIYYIVEGIIKCYNIDDGITTDIVYPDGGSHYCDLSFYDDNLYYVSYCSNNSQGDSVYKYNIVNHETAMLFEGINASIRFVNNKFLIFENREGLYAFDIEKSSQTLFLDKFVIDEIYVFDTNVYFYTTNINGIIELWKSDLNGSSVQKILG